MSEFGEADEASRRGRPELSDKVIESADSTDSLLPIRWLEFSEISVVASRLSCQASFTSMFATWWKRRVRPE